ncbi:MAG TPA: tRNA 2-thiouridine(34) synthase MnmA [Pirellulales bacterium]|nr:tRNA 2-thiouridine(34) synthase MnmA [Pirellulales bacterium]
MARVVLAMSGGVDSSVAAHLLVEQGHEVIGLFMRHGAAEAPACPAPSDTLATASSVLPILSRGSSHKQGCCSSSDAADARRVADRLGIDFYALNFADAFGQIIDYFVDEYGAGRTPNPCVMCNNWLKFGKLLDYADTVGAEFVATGHYAQLARGVDGRLALLRGVDVRKDQSYVLFGIDRQMLGRVMLPVGAFTKDAIRAQARDIGLRVADKRDSQEICFVPDGDYAALVRRRFGERSGELVTVDGQVVGRHEGIEHFTIGQRKGIGVALGEPQYVVRLEPETQRVVIGPREALLRLELFAARTNWHVDPDDRPIECSVQIRYNSAPAPARVTPLAGERMHVEFHTPLAGVAPGQAAVCYDGPRVLGGGWIE